MNRKFRTRWMAIAGSLLLLAACRDGDEAATDAKPLSGKVRVFGSSTGVPIVAPIADRFRPKHPAVAVEIEGSSSAWAIGYTRQGMVEVGISTRRPSAEEGLAARAIARDGLCLIVNKENPVSALSDDQIAGIFTGKIASWKEVGGADLEITRINHAEVRNSLILFTQYLKLQPSDMKYTDIVISSDPEAVKHVSSKPEAVTYMSIASALAAVERGSPIKLIGFGGAAPTVENVNEGKTPIPYEVYLVTKTEPPAAAKAFVDYAASSDVADVLKTHHFAPPKS